MPGSSPPSAGNGNFGLADVGNGNLGSFMWVRKASDSAIVGRGMRVF
ncbi:hypothetical protein [Mycobacterium bourgelatii]|nr:hypothetical protein [Mycobacterium bourgelatii]MCV6978503.1 hypothetical protein [Mycobacterium bourgelatii]